MQPDPAPGALTSARDCAVSLPTSASRGGRAGDRHRRRRPAAQLAQSVLTAHRISTLAAAGLIRRPLRSDRPALPGSPALADRRQHRSGARRPSGRTIMAPRRAVILKLIPAPWCSATQADRTRPSSTRRWRRCTQGDLDLARAELLMALHRLARSGHCGGAHKAARADVDAGRRAD